MQLLSRISLSIFSVFHLKDNYLEELACINELKKWLDRELQNTKYNRYMLRAICQYRAQVIIRSKFAVYLSNMIAILYFPVLLLKVGWCTRIPEQKRISCEYLKVNDDMAYQIPPQIKTLTMERKQIAKNSPDCYLLPEDLRFAFHYFRGAVCLYPELFVKFLIWVSTIRPHVDAVNCTHLIQYCESSATSSLRKVYLNSLGINLVNVTHGEEFITCGLAFSSFDKCYAWDITPRSIYNTLQIECGEFHTFNPCSEMRKVKEIFENPRIGILWPAFKVQQPECIAKQVGLMQKYYAVTVRPHPNELYRAKFDEYIKILNIDVSNPREEELDAFLDRCSIVVGYSSAVLLKAAWRGREVLYINDPCLESVRKYHTYYQSVSVVEVSEIANSLLNKVQ